MITSKELVDILDEYLKKQGISRREFCRLVDIPNTTISSWKTKNILPSIEFVAKIAKFMNISLDQLVYKKNLEIEQKFELKEMLNVYKIMFKYNYDSRYYMLISMIIFFYNKTSGRCIITKEQLIQYFEINLIPAAEDIYCPKMNIFDEETVEDFYELLFVLQLLSQYKDELLFNFEFIKKEHGWFYFQKYVFQDEPNEKIKENCFFEIRCFDAGNGYKAHFVYQDEILGECISYKPVFYKETDDNPFFIIKGEIN